jgi:hypothetical protein
MADFYFFVCPECGVDDHSLFEEDKIEETICDYCKDAPAECLIDGRPCCQSCKLNSRSKAKSPAGSIRSDGKAKQVSVIAGSFADQLKHGIKSKLKATDSHDTETPSVPAIVHKRGESAVTADLLKGHSFLQKYVNGLFSELVLLYSSKNEGISISAFKNKCEDSKNGLIVIVSLRQGLQVAAFSWKGIRKGMANINDSQLGGAIIRGNSFDMFKFRSNTIFNLPEGIKFSNENDLYINFMELEKSICNFAEQLRGNANWTNDIDEIKAYRLLEAE